MSILSKRFQGHLQRVEKIYGVYMFEILDYKVLLYFFFKSRVGLKEYQGIRTSGLLAVSEYFKMIVNLTRDL